jgi:hypothetical protein
MYRGATKRKDVLGVCKALVWSKHQDRAGVGPFFFANLLEVLALSWAKLHIPCYPNNASMKTSCHQIVFDLRNGLKTHMSMEVHNSKHRFNFG